MRTVFTRSSISLALLVLVSSILPARAETAQTVFDRYAYGGGNGARIEALDALPDADEVRFARGALLFLFAVEGLQQDLYRYGAGNVPAGRSPLAMLPIFRVPVPANPNAEVATYEISRKILDKFVERLKLAEAELSRVGDSDFGIEADLLRVTIDTNGDGQVGNDETLAAVINRLFVDPLNRSNRDAIPTLKKVRLDATDAAWLRGYSNLLMGFAEFFLAFDYSSTYESSFNSVFGNEATALGRTLKKLQDDDSIRAGLEKQIAEAKAQLETEYPETEFKLRLDRERQIRLDFGSTVQDKALDVGAKGSKLKDLTAEAEAIRLWLERRRAAQMALQQLQMRLSQLGSGEIDNDAESVVAIVAFIHSISWPVSDRGKLEASRKHVLLALRLNPEIWRRARAETDNRQEWLPNASQSGPFPSLPVTDAIIDGWLATTASAARVLEGELLLPSLRFAQGVNLKRYLDETERFDLVNFLAGVDSARFAESGEVWDGNLQRTLMGPFGNRFMPFAAWFN